MDDAAVAGELAAIAARLQALAPDPPSDSVSIGDELGQLRTHLRLLAMDNEEVGRRLAEQLGFLEPPTGPH